MIYSAEPTKCSARALLLQGSEGGMTAPGRTARLQKKRTASIPVPVRYRIHWPSVDWMRRDGTRGTACEGDLQREVIQRTGRKFQVRRSRCESVPASRNPFSIFRRGHPSPSTEVLHRDGDLTVSPTSGLCQCRSAGETPEHGQERESGARPLCPATRGPVEAGSCLPCHRLRLNFRRHFISRGGSRCRPRMV